MNKTVLVVSPYFPYPVYGGGHAALFNEVDIMRSICKVVFVCPYAAEETVSSLKFLWPDVTIYVLSSRRPARPQSLIKSLRKLLISSRKDYSSFYLQKPFIESFFSITYEVDEEWIHFLRNIINETHFDFIQTEFYPMLNNVSFLPREIPRIFVHHEIGFVKMERNIRLSEFSEIYKSTITENLKNIEVNFLNQYDKIITLSEHDKNTLVNSGVKTDVVSSPFPYISSSNDDNIYSYSKKLVFIGLESNYPNFDGLKWFINIIWPEILRNDEKTELNIIGEWSEKTIKELSGKNIRFLGFVDKLHEVVKNSISIVPVRICSGLRIKIMDAIANSIAVISTSAGAEGLPLHEMPGVFIADSAQAFVDRINYVCQNEREVNTFISVSKKKMFEQYSVENFIVSRKKLMDIV